MYEPRQNIKKLFLKAKGIVSRLILRLIIRPLNNILLGMLGSYHSQHLKKALTLLKDLAWLFFTWFRAGVERWDGAEWSVVFVHDGCTHSKEELCHLLFPEPPTQHDLGWRFLWQIPSVIKKGTQENHLVVCDLNRLMHWGTGFCYNFRVPPWLRASLNISHSQDEILNRITKNRRQWILKISSSEFSYEFSHRPDDFRTFYHKMYVPHVTKRHHERAILEPIEAKRAIFDKGGLLIVKYKGHPVAAGLRHIVKDNLIAAAYAIHQDHFQLIKHGVVVALHWYTIDWAYCNHLRYVDLGMTRPRLQDGVFEYKRQWGAQFERDILTHTMWSFIAQDLPHKLVSHLNELAFIAQVGSEYQCVVIENDLSDEKLAEREKLASKASLDGLLVLSDTELAQSHQQKV